MAAVAFAALILLLPGPATAVDDAFRDLLPVSGFAAGWTLDGKVELYDQDNLFNHINGEAELYFPYGFEMLASARYVHLKNADLSIVADVYRMGSLLDAFGIYSNYRKASNVWVTVGAEGFVSATQLLFYQDRYFVRLQVTGDTDVPKETLLACAKAISGKLPPGSGKPRELQAVKIAALAPHSERYLAKSLLGYDFFRFGIIADAVVQNERMQIIAIREKTEADARKTFDQYLAYLNAEAREIKLTGDAARKQAAASDPLYGGILIEQSGRHLIGVIRIKNNAAAGQVLEQLHRQIGMDTHY